LIKLRSVVLPLHLCVIKTQTRTLILRMRDNQSCEKPKTSPKKNIPIVIGTNPILVNPTGVHVLM